jgi:hypothetical protein
MLEYAPPSPDLSTSPQYVDVAMVDDLRDQLEMYALFINCCAPGKTHQEFQSGADFLLAIAQGLRPTHVVCDFRMPEPLLNGFQTIRALIDLVRLIPDMSMPHIILFTSNNISQSEFDAAFGEDKALVTLKIKVISPQEYVGMIFGAEEP